MSVPHKKKILVAKHKNKFSHKVLVRCLFFFSFIGICAYILTMPYNPAHEKTIICGVGKNIEFTLPHMIQKIESFPKVIVISENLTAEQLYNLTKAHALRDHAPNRMEIIAYARNKTLEIAMDPLFDDYRFLIMTDLDFNVGWSIEGVMSAFLLGASWDCLAANSMGYGPYYYDRYALRDKQMPLGPELLGETWWQDLNKFPIRISPMQPLVEVFSAFGGIAIYKRTALKNCYYSGYITQDLEKLLSDILNNRMAHDAYQYQLYKNLLSCNESHVPVKFIANSGYDAPAVCEHSTLHASMILRGFDKIFINPAMVCRY